MHAFVSRISPIPMYPGSRQERKKFVKLLYKAKNTGCLISLCPKFQLGPGTFDELSKHN